MTDDAPCSCPGPGRCPRFGTRMSAASHALCSGGTRASAEFRRRLALRMAEGPEPPPRRATPDVAREGPGLLRMAANAAQAVGRAARAAVRGEPVLCPPEVALARKAACEENACGHFDRERDRCTHRRCGCKLGGKLLTLGLRRPGKVELATEACPLAPPRWGRWEAPPAPAE